MSLFRARTASPERRDLTSSSTIPAPGEGYHNSTGMHVSTDSALRLAAVYGSVSIISDALSTTPIDVYRKRPDGRRVELETPALLNLPSGKMERVEWLSMVFASVLLRGNAYGIKDNYDDLGYPREIHLVHPDDVSVQHTSTTDPTPQYRFGNRPVDLRRVFHLKGFCLPGQLTGLSPVANFAQTIGAGLASEDFGARFYGEGGHPTAVLQTEHPVSQEAAVAIKSRVMNSIRGRREPIVLGAGLEWKSIQIPPGESMFLDSSKFSALQIAAMIYHVPPSMVGVAVEGSSLTYCADTETEILTLRGWLRYDEVRETDTCLTLNMETGLSEWQPVDAVNVFEGPHDVVRIKSKSHSSVTTLNHRWPVLPADLVGNKWRWRETQNLCYHDRILAAAPVQNGPTEPKWSDSFVELVAWYWTEGWTGEYGSVTITQSHKVNPEHVAAIRAAMVDVFGAPTLLKFVRSEPAWHEMTEERGITRFHLNKLAAARLCAVAPNKVVATWFLAELTRSQLELFIQKSVDADGSVASNGTAVLLQNDLARVEAFQVACALAGRSGVIHQNAAGMWSMAVRRGPWRKPRGHQHFLSRDRIDGRVWCPSTQNRTWFARREGTTYFTGNSNREQDEIMFQTRALLPWAVRFEQHISRLLPGEQYVRFNMDAAVRVDLTTRYNAHAVGIGSGFLLPDEARELEDRPPLSDSGSDTRAARNLVEMVQKVYLGVGVVLTPQEAREMLNRAGAGLSPDAPELNGTPTALTPPKEDSDE